jgi:hypothetical protein
MRSDSGEPFDIPTSSTAATQGGRFEIASICSFSTKIVSVRTQLWLRIVRSSSSELPTRLQSGWVLVTSGVFLPVLALHVEHANERALAGQLRPETDGR